MPDQLTPEVWDFARRYAELEEIVADLRHKLVAAGVEGSPPPGTVGTIPLLLERAQKAEAERDALAKFKAWVHNYLDAKGVPTHPGGPHSAEGCRIGDRMDWVFAALERLKAVSPRAS